MHFVEMQIHADWKDEVALDDITLERFQIQQIMS